MDQLSLRIDKTGRSFCIAFCFLADCWEKVWYFISPAVFGSLGKPLF
jgi:hypothetical protein